MQKELEELQPKLTVAKEENAKMMTVIEKESTEVAARSKVVKKDEEVANKQAAEAQALKDEVRGRVYYLAPCSVIDYHTPLPPSLESLPHRSLPPRSLPPLSFSSPPPTFLSSFSPLLLSVSPSFPPFLSSFCLSFYPSLPLPSLLSPSLLPSARVT